MKMRADPWKFMSSVDNQYGALKPHLLWEALLSMSTPTQQSQVPLPWAPVYPGHIPVAAHITVYCILFIFGSPGLNTEPGSQVGPVNPCLLIPLLGGEPLELWAYLSSNSGPNSGGAHRQQAVNILEAFFNVIGQGQATDKHRKQSPSTVEHTGLPTVTISTSKI